MPVSAINSAGLVNWRIHTGTTTVGGPALCTDLHRGPQVGSLRRQKQVRTPTTVYGMRQCRYIAGRVYAIHKLLPPIGIIVTGKILGVSQAAVEKGSSWQAFVPFVRSFLDQLCTRP